MKLCAKLSLHSSVVLLLALSVISGCSSTPSVIEYKLAPSHEITAPKSVFDADVGIYYASNYANYIHKQSFSNSIVTANAGKESVELFNAAIPETFKKTKVINKMPPYDIAKSDMDGIIEPRLDYVSWGSGFDSSDEFFHVEYTFIFYTSEGVPISFWTIVGNGEYLQNQMQDVAQKFVSGFNDADETRRFREYLANRKIGDITFDVKDINVSASVVEDNPLGLQLKDSGILPIRVKVTNNTGTDVSGRGFDARLIYDGNKRLAPAFPLAVISATEYMAAMNATDPVNVAALFGPLAMIPTMMGQSSGRVDERKAQSDYFEKARLKEITLSNGESIQGTLYFTVPDDMPILQRGVLSIWFVNPSAANGARKEINLPDLNYVKQTPEELKRKAEEREVKMEVTKPGDEFE